MVGLKRWFVLAPALAVQVAHAELAIPPAGYHWFEMRSLASAFLVPSGWRAIRSQGKLRGSLTVRPAPAGRAPAHTPSFSVNAVDNLQRIGHRHLHAQIAQFIASITGKPGTEVLATERLERAPYRGTAVLYKAAGFTHHRSYLAHPQTDRLLIMSFTAPDNDWASAWRHGRIMTERFCLFDP